MPIYQFEDTRTGEIVELFRTVECRDFVEPHLKRITVPQRVGYANASHLREPGAAADVPKAFREYELSGADVHKIQRETGFKRESIRRIWNFLWLAFCLVTLSANAADIGAGYSFTPNDRVTAAKLNSLVGGASINTTFATDKASAQALAADTLVFYQTSSGQWRKTTFDQLLLSNTNLIVGQLEATPTTNDFFLFYDASAGTFAKVSLNGILTNDFLILNRDVLTNSPVPEQSKLLVYANTSQGVGVFSLTWSNMFQYFWRDERFSTNVGYTDPLTNPFVISIHTAPTNRDALMIWDAQHQTMKGITLDGLVTNLPPVPVGLTNDDTLGFFISTRTNANNPFGTNNVLSKVRLADLQTNWQEVAAGTVANNDTFVIFSTSTNASPTRTNFIAKVKMSSLIQKFYTNGIPVGGTSLLAQGLHGLGGTPQVIHWYFVCTNSTGDGNYVQGDVIPIEDIEDNAGGPVAMAGGANATQVFLNKRVANLRASDKNSVSALTLTLTRWNAVCEAIYYP